MNITPAHSFTSFNSPAFGAVGASSLGEENATSRRQSIPPVDETAQGAATSDKRDGSDRSSTTHQLAQADRNAENTAERQAAKADQLQEVRDQEIISELKARDREVRAHEAAHAAVGGQYAGAPTYSFQQGPNGVSYAVGGEVSISTSAIANDPQATLEKAQQVKRAALAPAEPSSQDRRVAAEATQMATQARVDLAELNRNEQSLEQTLNDINIGSTRDPEGENAFAASSYRQNTQAEPDTTAGSDTSVELFASSATIISGQTAESLTGLSMPFVDVQQLLASSGVGETVKPGQIIDRQA